MLRRAELAHVVDVLRDVLDGRPAVLPQEIRIEVHADPAAALCHRADLVVRQVAEVVAQRPRAGMGGHRRLAVPVDQVPEARLVQVARVGGHAQGRHLAQDHPALRLDALLRAALGRVADLVFVVPGQRRHADAALVKLAHALRAALEDLAALDGEQDLDTALLGLQRGVDLLPALRLLKMLKRGVFGHRLVVGMIAHSLAPGEERAGLQAHAARLHMLQGDAGHFIRLERAHVQRIAMCIADDHGQMPPFTIWEQYSVPWEIMQAHAHPETGSRPPDGSLS